LKLAKSRLKQIIKEESERYLEEIRALDPEFYKQAYEKGHIPFTKPHRTADRRKSAEMSALDVMTMVYGDPKGTPGYKEWPQIPQEHDAAVEYLTQIHGIPKDIVVDQEGNPRIPWSIVQALAKKDMEKYKQQQLAESNSNDENLKETPTLELTKLQLKKIIEDALRS